MSTELTVNELIAGNTIKINNMICKFCGKSGETREGGCFDCAEAEAIIAQGLDMYDKGPSKSDKPAKSAGEKLKFLIEKGWVVKK